MTSCVAGCWWIPVCNTSDSSWHPLALTAFPRQPPALDIHGRISMSCANLPRLSTADDPLAALVSWVEDDEAPESLYGETASMEETHFTHKICRYPLKPKHIECGSTALANNYKCV